MGFHQWFLLLDIPIPLEQAPLARRDTDKTVGCARRPAPSPIDGPSSKPPLPLDPDNSTSMLMRWVYDIHDVTLAEKLQRQALRKGVTGAGGLGLSG